MIDFFDNWYLGQNWDDFEGALNEYETFLNVIEYGGENIPSFMPNYGPGIMAAVFGIEPKFQSRTNWFHRETSVEEIVPLLESAKLNMNNPWYARLKKVTEIAAKRAKGNYNVSITDIGGVLDILSSFLGPTNILLIMRRNPEIIDSCRAIILEKLLKVYDDLQTIIDQYCDGFNSWMNIWCPKRWYPIQCDFSAMLNPKWFKRFALPDIIAQAEHMDYAIYHLDGPNALVHLNDLLETPSITGIQWVPGAGKDLLSSEKWMPIYNKIQATGKSVVLDLFPEPEQLSYFYKVLNPKLIYSCTIFMDRARALFYLPKFIGGEGGEGNYREYKKEYRKRMKLQKFTE